MSRIFSTKRLLIEALAAALLLAGIGGVIIIQAAGTSNARGAANALAGTAFTYQGVLKDGDAPAGGLYDLRFELFDEPLSGNQVGPSVLVDDVAVSEGLFTAVLDFGEVFDGSPRHLEVAVRQGNSDDPYSVLSPRQALTPVPFSVFAGAAPWDGLIGMPAGIADGDNDTTYSAGFGLSLQRGQFLVNRSQIQLRVSGSCPEGQSIRAVATNGDVTCETDSDTIYEAGFGLTVPQLVPLRYQVDETVIQRRVTENCAVGQAISAIDEDGNVTCQDVPVLPIAPRPLNSNGAVDLPDDVGRFSSITTGSDGLPLISYYDATNGDLKVAHCNDLACSAPTKSTLDSLGNVGQHTSLTIGSDGLGLISYYDAGKGDLKVAHCDDLACSNATVTTVASDGDVGQYSSIAIGVDGLGLISYYDASTTALMVAHCESVDCSATPTINTVDDNGDVGKYSSIAIGVDGLGIISYYDEGGNRNLKVAHCKDVVCSASSTRAKDISNDVGRYTSLTIGADGLPLISYVELASTDSLLWVLHCGDVTCFGNPDIHLVDFLPDSNRLSYSAITTGSDGLALISYYRDGELKVAHCNNQVCNSIKSFILDSQGDVGQYNGITVGPDGLAYISYYRADVPPNTFGNLKLARTVLGRGNRNR